MMHKENSFKKVGTITFYAFLAVVLSYVFIKYILVCILPFLLAFTIAHSTRRIVLFLGSKFRFKRSFSVFVITTAILAVFSSLIYLLLSKIISELSGLTKYISEDGISEFFTDTAKTASTFISGYFPKFARFFYEALKEIAGNIDRFFNTALETLLPFMGKSIMALIKAFPSFLLFTFVTLIAMFYFGNDYEKIISVVKLQLSEKQLKFICQLKNEFFSTLLKILRAYTVLLSLTFLQLLTGFIISGIRYPVILAVFISLIDILPVLGTGTILVPWCIILFLSGNVKTGLCILILYVIITVTRQIAEPKILGSSVGLHPLVTLMAMYFGLKLIGIKGLFIFPIVLIILKNLNEKGFIRLYKNPEKSNLDITSRRQAK